jgi:hypothetical protein
MEGASSVAPRTQLPKAQAEIKTYDTLTLRPTQSGLFSWDASA